METHRENSNTYTWQHGICPQFEGWDEITEHEEDDLDLSEAGHRVLVHFERAAVEPVGRCEVAEPLHKRILTDYDRRLQNPYVQDWDDLNLDIRLTRVLALLLTAVLSCYLYFLYSGTSTQTPGAPDLLDDNRVVASRDIGDGTITKEALAFMLLLQMMEMHVPAALPSDSRQVRMSRGSTDANRKT